MAPFPVITEEHVEAVLYLLNKGTAWRPQSKEKLRLKELLLPCVVQYCEITEFQYPILQKEQQSINYLKASMITNIKINVQEHYMKILKFVKSILLLDEIPESLDDLNELESELLEEIWSLLITHTEPTLPFHILWHFSASPLRHSINQSHVRIDTVILYSHILELTRKEAGEKVDMKYELWSQVFNLNNKAFQPGSGISFEGSITTDETSISVYLKHP
ncbi:hypothetical protein HDU92_000893 [Lobulomyces angularis]|nr:hypothetical protein HDU92_000893 [Lobulomyces angularis]